MRSDLTQDTYLIQLALADAEILKQQYEQLNNDEVALAIKYNVPLKEMMDKLIGTKWFLPELTYQDKQKWVAEHRLKHVSKYCEQILELYKLAIGDCEYVMRRKVLASLLREGRSTMMVNRIYDKKPFCAKYSFPDDSYRVKHNFAQQAIAKMLDEYPSEYRRILENREQIFAPLTLKLQDLLNHLASYMNIFGISRYLGWDRTKTRRQLQQMGIIPVEGRIYLEQNDNPDRIGGGKWDYMIGRTWANGTMKVLHPMGFRKLGGQGYVPVILADASIFTDDLHKSRYHVLYHRVKCDRCKWEMNLSHQFIMHNGHCPICLEQKKARESGRQPNYKKFGLRYEGQRTLLSKPPSPSALPYLEGDEPIELVEFMQEAIAQKDLVD